MRPNKAEPSVGTHKGKHAEPRSWIRGRPYNEHLYYRRETKRRLRRERAKLRSR